MLETLAALWSFCQDLLRCLLKPLYWMKLIQTEYWIFHHLFRCHVADSSKYQAIGEVT